MRSSDHLVTLSLNVEKIEAEAMYKPSELDTQKIYFRRIRFTTRRGDVIEVFCSSDDEKGLEILNVAELLPLKKPRARKAPITWLQPKDYEGISKEEKEWLNKK
jgi:hypothetical protein